MQDRFFEQPILNSPYEYPTQYWELDEDGQPTYRIIDGRRSAEFVTPIPKPKRTKVSAQQARLALDNGSGAFRPRSVVRRLGLRQPDS